MRNRPPRSSGRGQRWQQLPPVSPSAPVSTGVNPRIVRLAIAGLFFLLWVGVSLAWAVNSHINDRTPDTIEPAPAAPRVDQAGQDSVGDIKSGCSPTPNNGYQVCNEPRGEDYGPQILWLQDQTKGQLGKALSPYLEDKRYQIFENCVADWNPNGPKGYKTSCRNLALDELKTDARVKPDNGAQLTPVANLYINRQRQAGVDIERFYGKTESREFPDGNFVVQYMSIQILRWPQGATQADEVKIVSLGTNFKIAQLGIQPQPRPVPGKTIPLLNNPGFWVKEVVASLFLLLPAFVALLWALAYRLPAPPPPAPSQPSRRSYRGRTR